MIRLLLSILLGLCATPLLAQERILSYDSELQVNADGSLDVTERIRVRAEGQNIRRGIYRDFPTRYRDRHGNRVVVDFEMLGLLRDGRTEPYFIEQLNNGVRVNFGGDDFLPVPAAFTYELRYRTSRQIGFFDAHDELYWNAIGLGWMFPIEAGSVTLRLPDAVPVDALLPECWTGPQGSRAQACTAVVTGPSEARWTLTAPLDPGEGLTTVLAFPKGLAPEPTTAQKAHWLLRDNRAPLIALVGLLSLLAFGFQRWFAVGRDPKAGTIIVLYDPPDDLSPAALRHIEKNHTDTRAFSADVLSLAVARRLEIHRNKKLLEEDWRVERSAGEGRPVSAEQDALLTDLFKDGDQLELDNTHASRMQTILAAHQKRIKAAMKLRFPKGLYRYNGKSLFGLLAILLGFGAATFTFGGGQGLLPAIVIVVLMVVAFFVFLFLIPAVTPDGRAMRDRIDGFKRYLTVADQQDLARLKGPGDDAPLHADRFEFLLPYAVALEVEDAWTQKFTAAVGAAAVAGATASMTWYHATGHLGSGGAGDIAGFSKAIGNSFSAQIASSSTPPGSASGSSSGGGGGGFSGGGVDDDAICALKLLPIALLKPAMSPAPPLPRCPVA
ncbi:conserved membrane hypothetical protein [Luteimonas sp. 9C]|uniref:DUF2207 domain-containing protein n=1 Tax=Luteimonas sp. 9C TaxID=2653148 RepID=UPI0012F12EAA|nr:DUF2207 domain-containing protein [Luteimonas sp. 9C]VXB36283.1 conserved membrane hypothetical protein [Luteimonas sp. 9C]